ncbi:MAG TPA: efflux RND transporter periplasmic adaptor subunit [Bryobacteraceae bacterium]|nr:efflux RND transporter periplasmic adaptor subunit [Bryobacteraceae bacterium]
MRRPSWRWLWVVVVAGAAAIGFWQLDGWRRQPPEISFARATRETIASTVPTNGKVEPIEWATARAARQGPVQEILVQRGQKVNEGDVLIAIDSADSQAELSAAQARVVQIQAELETLSKGGRATDLAEISSGLERARLDLKVAQNEYDTLLRLQARQAATPLETAAAKEKVDRARLQIESLQQRKAALVAVPDRTSAEARLHDAQAAAELAQSRISQSVVRAPLSGTVYQFDLKRGAYVNAGDVIASIGRLDRVHVTVYVDEPDLGRVAKGMPASITWDALPGRVWKGTVDRTASQIVALGSRQVGEVACLIENPDMDLLPGTNVNVEIRSHTVENAVTIPKEAVRRESGQTGVFSLNGDRLAWRKITQGVNNTTRVQVSELGEGDAVALPSERTLKQGMQVQPVFP